MVHASAWPKGKQERWEMRDESSQTGTGSHCPNPVGLISPAGHCTRCRHEVSAANSPGLIELYRMLARFMEG